MAAAGMSRHSPGECSERQAFMMLRWILIFLIVALVAAVLGFGGIAVDAAGIAKILFLVFFVAFLISALFSMGGGKRPPMPPVL
jgi:uncharacterized membrane protein YtjA (UPF0391 family)